MPSPEVCVMSCRIVDDVTQRGRSLDRAYRQRSSNISIISRSEVREISWGSIRWYYHYRTLIMDSVSRPLRGRDKIIEALLVCGLYQLDHLNEPDYAIIYSTVESCRHLQCEHKCGLVNAVLRGHQRKHAEHDIGLPLERSMPDWLAKAIQKHWPNDWVAIAEAYNEKPPLTLRINNQKRDTNSYLSWIRSLGLSGYQSQLSASAISLTAPLPVDRIPGFREGHVSIQDSGAQLAPHFTGDLSGCTVLDACASPGGKTCQLLEITSAPLSVTSLDLPHRTKKIEENLIRLGLNANVIAGDAAHPQEWWDNHPFDCIIIDAPCSATGVIRRHPDIRVNRKKTDVAQFQLSQISLLQALWTVLRPGGRLVYITCSILPPENDHVIAEFLEKTPDARTVLMSLDFGITTTFGNQLLPHPGGSDGFFYAALDRII